MGKILPILLALIGLGAGIGGGIAFRPPPEIVEINPCGEPEAGADHTGDIAHSGDGAGEDGAENANSDFVKMNNQFVVPVVSDSKVTALVVMSLSLELEPGGSEVFYQREPKLRDAFLQILFDHANIGGFDGVFTDGSKMDNLRAALSEIAKKTMGDTVRDVLVIDILRQDI
ncbi:MAG: flagellar basal body-associated FliL family protein [Rhodobacteraceae bacterium]|nr:flagellar basal body-associated FliL family protein [Paracoccaceae bacterium]